MAISNSIPSLYKLASTHLLNNWKVCTEDKVNKDSTKLFDAWEELYTNKDSPPHLKDTMKKVQNLVTEELKEEAFLSECKSNGRYDKFLENDHPSNCCKSATSIEMSVLKNFKDCSIAEETKLNIKNKYTSIEKLFIEKCKSNGEFDEFFKQCKLDKSCKTVEELVLENTHQLFFKLASYCDTYPISVDPNAYQSWCNQQDEALESTWLHESGIRSKLIESQLCTAQIETVMASNTAAEIRAWMANPENAEALNSITDLNFYDCKLKTIPLEILNLPKLETLSLCNNQITTIPDALASSQLTKLDLSGNQITAIPDALANSRLTELDLSGNQITAIPDAIANSQLTELDLSGNQITVIPDALANSQLTKLNLNRNQIAVIPNALASSQLTWLELNANQIKTIPDAIANSQLKNLCLSGNQIAIIPNALANSQLLEICALDHNWIEVIPDTLVNSRLIALSLNGNRIAAISDALANSQLTHLFLSDNQITVIPDALAKSQLNVLDLSNNQITVIPDALVKSQLQELNLFNNPIEVIPDALTANSELRLFIGSML
jgi:Leucine-rich repeat (LRR) protein